METHCKIYGNTTRETGNTAKRTGRKSSAGSGCPIHGFENVKILLGKRKAGNGGGDTGKLGQKLTAAVSVRGKEDTKTFNP